MASNASAAIGGHFSRDDVRRAQHRALRIFVGRGAEYSFKELARLANIDLARLHDLAERPDSPEWRPWTPEEQMSLVKVLGGDLLTEYFRDAGVGGFDLPDPDNDRPLKEIVSDMAKDSATLTAGALDRGGNVVDLHMMGDRSMSRGAAMKAIAQQGDRQGSLFGGRAA